LNVHYFEQELNYLIEIIHKNLKQILELEIPLKSILIEYLNEYEANEAMVMIIPYLIKGSQCLNFVDILSDVVLGRLRDMKIERKLNLKQKKLNLLK